MSSSETPDAAQKTHAQQAVEIAARLMGVIAIASIAVFAAALVMLNMVLKSGGAKT